MENIDSLLAGPSKDIWTNSLSNEWGYLAQDNIHGIRNNDTIEFIHRSLVPHGRYFTCSTFVLDFRPLKMSPIEYALQLVVIT